MWVRVVAWLLGRPQEAPLRGTKLTLFVVPDNVQKVMWFCGGRFDDQGTLLASRNRPRDCIGRSSNQREGQSQLHHVGGQSWRTERGCLRDRGSGILLPGAAVLPWKALHFTASRFSWRKMTGPRDSLAFAPANRLVRGLDLHQPFKFRDGFIAPKGGLSLLWGT